MRSPRLWFLAATASSLVACNAPSAPPDCADAGHLEPVVDAGVDAGLEPAACRDVIDLATDSRVARATDVWRVHLELVGAGSLPPPATCIATSTGAERVTKLTLPRRARVSAVSSLASGAAHSLWVSSACGAVASSCATSTTDERSASLFQADVAAGTTLFFTLDAPTDGGPQTAELEVRLTPLAELGEACSEPDLPCADERAVCAGAPGAARCVLSTDLLGQRCASAMPVSSRVSGTLQTSEATGVLLASCRFNPMATRSYPEQIFTFTPATTAAYVARTTSPATHLDTLVSVRAACSPTAAELACNEDVAMGDLRSQVLFDGVAGQTVFIVVQAGSTAAWNDELRPADDGAFELVVEPL
ncbi:MAG: hypothetical protein ACOZQL_04160 [Myxococcota bacterium]